MTSYRLPRQHARSAKRPSTPQLLKIIGKTKSVTYRFYFFVGNLFKFFNLLESMTKSYLAVNWVMPPTNETQDSNPGNGSQQK